MSRSTGCCWGFSERAVGCVPVRPGRRCPVRWSGWRAPRRSTPSAAGSTRCSARSSLLPASRWPAAPGDLVRSLQTMDFSLTDDQESLRTLAADIFGDKATPERVEQIEDSAERFDRDLWRELADAGLLGISLPESAGGAGLGLVE